jgi:hypothetical protein
MEFLGTICIFRNIFKTKDSKRRMNMCLERIKLWLLECWWETRIIIFWLNSIFWSGNNNALAYIQLNDSIVKVETAKIGAKIKYDSVNKIERII